MALNGLVLIIIIVYYARRQQNHTDKTPKNTKLHNSVQVKTIKNH